MLKAYSLSIRRIISLLFIPLTCMLCLESNAQKLRLSSNAALAEKVYLQTDGEVYALGQTVWFKAMVVMASDHSLTTLSGVLYVELISPDESLVERKLIKLEKGIGTGFIDLEPEYTTGQYLLRAYTEWNKNYEREFIFKSYLQVYPSKDVAREEPISNTTLITEKGVTRLKADLNPQLIDSLHKDKLWVHLNIDDKKDSLSLKRRGGKYTLDYELPANTRVLNVRLETDNKVRFSKSLLVDEKAMDLSFFPESGEMVHGVKSQVAYKAVNPDGSGRKVSGRIIDDTGRLISEFESNELGMGSVMILADSSRSYYASISGGENLVLKYPLPEVAAKGYVLSAARIGEQLVVNAITNDRSQDSLLVQISSRGRYFFDIKGPVDREGHLQFILANNRLPEGVVIITLINNQGVSVAERLFFVQRPDQRLQLTVTTEKAEYEQRDKTEVKVNALDFAGMPIDVSLSAMVINKSQMGDLQSGRNSLLPYLLLSSDLKGDIEKPGFYFSEDNENKEQDLDYLMLTQGWRLYKYKEMPVPNRYQPEYNLTVSGTVGGVLSQKKKKEDIALTLMAFGEDSRGYQRTTDSLGRFYFDINDEFGREINVAIQAKNKRGKNRPFSIKLDPKSSPKITFDHRKPIQPVDSTVVILAKKQQERLLIDDAYGVPNDVRDLGVVVVEDYALTPLREKMMEAHGKPDVVVDGEEVREAEEKWSYGLYSVLRNSMRNELLFTQANLFQQNFVYAEAHGSDLTLVMVDGVLVRLEFYSLIPNIPVSDVKSVEILKSPKNFFNLFYQLFPPDAEIPLSPSILAIYTHTGKGIFSTNIKAGMFRGSIPVYAPDREFYAPAYEKLTAQDWVKPDYRALVHWQPIVALDDEGNGSFSFYNADLTDEMMVVVEAIAPNGQLGYQEFTYQVKKRKDRP